MRRVESNKVAYQVDIATYGPTRPGTVAEFIHFKTSQGDETRKNRMNSEAYLGGFRMIKCTSWSILSLINAIRRNMLRIIVSCLTFDKIDKGGEFYRGQNSHSGWSRCNYSHQVWMPQTGGEIYRRAVKPYEWIPRSFSLQSSAYCSPGTVVYCFGRNASR